MLERLQAINQGLWERERERTQSSCHGKMFIGGPQQKRYAKFQESAVDGGTQLSYQYFSWRIGRATSTSTSQFWMAGKCRYWGVRVECTCCFVKIEPLKKNQFLIKIVITPRQTPEWFFTWQRPTIPHLDTLFLIWFFELYAFLCFLSFFPSEAEHRFRHEHLVFRHENGSKKKKKENKMAKGSDQIRSYQTSVAVVISTHVWCLGGCGFKLNGRHPSHALHLVLPSWFCMVKGYNVWGVRAMSITWNGLAPQVHYRPHPTANYLLFTAGKCEGGGETNIWRK